MRSKTSIKRISKDLADEIERIARQNQKTFVEASKELANVSRKNRGKKFKRSQIIEF